MMNPIKKTTWTILIIFVLIVTLAACSSNDNEPNQSAQNQDEKNEQVQDKQNANNEKAAEEKTEIEHLRIGTNAFSAGMEATRTSNADAQTQYAIYDTLIMRDPFSEELKFIPGLAVSWENVEPTVWELELRENVKFHDGNIMDAEDVAFSLNRIFKAEDPRFNNAYGRYFNTFEEVEIIDSHKVRIHLKRPDPLAEIFLSDLSGAITSKAYIEEVGEDAADHMPVGTGPYKVVSFTPSERAEFERFDEYWGDPAPVKKLTFIHMPEIASRVTAIANNEIDIAIGIPTDQEASLAGQGVELIDTAYPIYHTLVYNMGNDYMGAHPKLRQALDMAIDREGLNQAIWGGRGVVPTSFQFSDYGDMYMPDLQTIQYDPEKAKQLVEESGYDGTTIVILNRADYYVNMDLALQAIVEMWAEIGVNAEIRNVPNVNDTPDEEMMIRTWSNPLYYPDPMALIDGSWSETIWVSTRNIWVPQNPEWFTNFEIARFSTDIDERKEAIRNLNEIAIEEAGFSHLYIPHEYMAVKVGIQYTVPKNYRAYTLALRAGEITFE